MCTTSPSVLKNSTSSRIWWVNWSRGEKSCAEPSQDGWKRHCLGLKMGDPKMDEFRGDPRDTFFLELAFNMFKQWDTFTSENGQTLGACLEFWRLLIVPAVRFQDPPNSSKFVIFWIASARNSDGTSSNSPGKFPELPVLCWSLAMPIWGVRGTEIPHDAPFNLESTEAHFYKKIKQTQISTCCSRFNIWRCPKMVLPLNHPFL